MRKTTRMMVYVFTLVLIASLWPGMVAAAQEEQPSADDVNEVAKQLYCPVCENVPLDVCGTQACAQWRDLIREKLGEGWDEDQIKDYFVAQYGDRVLAEPPARGLNWLAYLVPPVAFVAGAYILYRGLRSWRQITDASLEESPETPTPADDEYLARIERELREQ
jgi:cytochrome c-type biogenesis protein CcmH